MNKEIKKKYKMERTITIMTSNPGLQQQQQQQQQQE